MTEEEHYEAVLEEVSKEPKRKGLWAKALAQCDGDEQRAHHCYVKLRVEQRIEEEGRVLDQQNAVVRLVSADLRKKARSNWLVGLATILIVIIAAWGKSSGLGGEFQIDFVFQSITRYSVNGIICLALLALLNLPWRSGGYPWRIFVGILMFISAIQALLILSAPAVLHERRKSQAVVRSETAQRVSSSPAPALVRDPHEFVPLDPSSNLTDLDGFISLMDLPQDVLKEMDIHSGRESFRPRDDAQRQP